MDKLKWLIFILLISTVTQAQETTIKWGPTYKEKTKEGKNFYSKTFLGTTQNHYYLYATTRKKGFLLQFDYDNKLVHEVPTDLEYENNKLSPYTLIHNNTGDYLISSFFNKKENEMSVFSTKLEANGQVSTQHQLLFTYPYWRNNRGFSEVIPNKDPSGFTFSADSSKVLFYYTESPYDLKDKFGADKYSFAVFDKAMNLVWKKNIEFPYTDKAIDVKKIRVSNQGDVIVLGAIKAPKKSKVKREFLVFNIKENSIDQFDILKIEEKYPIDDAYLHLHPDNSIYVIGCYGTERIPTEGAKGLFMVKYSAQGEQQFLKTYPWTNNIRKAKNVINSLSFNHALVNHENGNITLVAENSYDRFDSQARRITQHYSNYMIIPSFSFEGVLKWVTVVEKEFQSNKTSPMSYVFAHKDDNIYLIFNDRKNEKEREKLNAPLSLLLTYYFTDLAKIDASGNIDLRKTLFNSRDLKFYYNVENSSFLKNGQVLIAGQSIKNMRSDYKFGKLILP